MYKQSPFTDLNSSIKKVELEQLAKGDIYPVTIVMDRYSGAYSGAKWLAFNLDPCDIPDEIGGSDPEEMMFWREHDEAKLPIGKGEAPGLAINDLIIKMKRYYENW